MQDIDLNWVVQAVGRTREELGDANLGYLLSAVGALLSSY